MLFKVMVVNRNKATEYISQDQVAVDTFDEAGFFDDVDLQEIVQELVDNKEIVQITLIREDYIPQ